MHAYMHITETPNIYHMHTIHHTLTPIYITHLKHSLTHTTHIVIVHDRAGNSKTLFLLPNVLRYTGQEWSSE